MTNALSFSQRVLPGQRSKNTAARQYGFKARRKQISARKPAPKIRCDDKIA
ncbi:MAG: hypothetical protein U0987_02220 [Afipia sp.]|jgi:hypothetical protein|nr:hypothetical protein [Afipia sp.]